MTINDFVMPETHPWGMLEKYNNASQKESVLAFILGECVKAGKFHAVETKHSHPAMVEDGFLICEREHPPLYRLTKKAIGLLYSVYGKEAESDG